MRVMPARDRGSGVVSESKASPYASKGRGIEDRYGLPSVIGSVSDPQPVGQLFHVCATLVVFSLYEW